MTCDRFEPDEALRWGFLNHVYPADRLIEEARTLAAKLLAKDELALARTKATTNALAQAMVPPQVTYSDPDYLARGMRATSPDDVRRS